MILKNGSFFTEEKKESRRFCQSFQEDEKNLPSKYAIWEEALEQKNKTIKPYIGQNKAPERSEIMEAGKKISGLMIETQKKSNTPYDEFLSVL